MTNLSEYTQHTEVITGNHEFPGKTISVKKHLNSLLKLGTQSDEGVMLVWNRQKLKDS